MSQTNKTKQSKDPKKGKTPAPSGQGGFRNKAMEHKR
jgi:hypothetical protein